MHINNLFWSTPAKGSASTGSSRWASGATNPPAPCFRKAIATERAPPNNAFLCKDSASKNASAGQPLSMARSHHRTPNQA